MVKTTIPARASSARRINLGPLKSFDWEAWKNKFGKKQEPYDIKDTRPKYEQPRISYQRAGSDRTVIYGQPEVNLRDYKKPIATKPYNASPQNYKFN